MNEDNYFQKKADDLAKMINTEIQFNTSWEDILCKTKLFLKEVAERQRNACVDGFYSCAPTESSAYKARHIQNAQIKGE